MLALLIALAPLAGGEIFGDLRAGESYLANVSLQLTCGEEKVEASTDKAGSFRIRSKASGKCKLQVNYKEQTPTIDIVVFEQPTRYRLVLEEQGGKFVLKRV
jgi:hypothetical protein